MKPRSSTSTLLVWIAVLQRGSPGGHPVRHHALAGAESRCGSMMQLAPGDAISPGANGSLDLDLPRRGLRRRLAFRNADRQHALVERGFGAVEIESVGQWNDALEAAERALDPIAAFLVLAGLELFLAS